MLFLHRNSSTSIRQDFFYIYICYTYTICFILSFRYFKRRILITNKQLVLFNFHAQCVRNNFKKDSNVFDYEADLVTSNCRYQILFYSDHLVPIGWHRQVAIKKELSKGVFVFQCYVKFKKVARNSRTTPPLSGPINPLRLPLQFGWNKENCTW